MKNIGIGPEKPYRSSSSKDSIKAEITKSSMPTASVEND